MIIKIKARIIIIINNIQIVFIIFKEIKYKIRINLSLHIINTIKLTTMYAQNMINLIKTIKKKLLLKKHIFCQKHLLEYMLLMMILKIVFISIFMVILIIIFILDNFNFY